MIGSGSSQMRGTNEVLGMSKSITVFNSRIFYGQYGSMAHKFYPESIYLHSLDIPSILPAYQSNLGFYFDVDEHRFPVHCSLGSEI